MKVARMFSRIKTIITGIAPMTPLWINKAKSAALLTLAGLIASAFTSFAANPYLVRTFEQNGRMIDEIIVPGSPPPAIRPEAAAVPEPNLAAGINTLANMPAFSWCYGCSATSAAMMMGYYDNQGFPNMYPGPANFGVCPMNNNTYWGNGESPLSATHIGKDGRTARGHVEDYWIATDNPGPDPYIVNGWTEHIQGDCTGDFMGTSQSKFSSVDGSTTFYNNTDGSPLYDYTDCEPAKRDGCHGMKLFVNSRGYTVSANYSQYIYGWGGRTLGFTYANFKAEIDAGRPVMIQVTGHTMVGYGYNDTGNMIYIRDTWDNSGHQMPWGGIYSGMQHYGVTVLRLQAPIPVADKHIINDYDGDLKSDLAVYSGGSWYIASVARHVVLNIVNGWGGPGWTPVPGDYDGDGKSDLAVYSGGSWYIRSVAKGIVLNIVDNWGAAGWTPVSGDYDGDGKSDIAVYSGGSWYIASVAKGIVLNIVNGWGGPGWTPVSGDYDGDGKSDLAVYNNGSWYIRSVAKGIVLNIVNNWGGPGWTPVR